MEVQSYQRHLGINVGAFEELDSATCHLLEPLFLNHGFLLTAYWVLIATILWETLVYDMSVFCVHVLASRRHVYISLSKFREEVLLQFTWHRPSVLSLIITTLESIPFRSEIETTVAKEGTIGRSSQSFISRWARGVTMSGIMSVDDNLPKYDPLPHVCSMGTL